MLRAATNRAFGISSASIAASAAGWIGSRGWPTTRAGAVDLPAALAASGAIRPKKMPWIDRGHRRRAAGRGCRGRCRPRTARARAGTGRVSRRRPADRERQEAGQRTSAAPKAMMPGLEGVVEHRHLERSAPAPARARASATSSETLAPSDVPPIDRLRRRRGGRAARRPARRTPSSSRPAGPAGRSERPWPSRSRVTTCRPSAASARASGWCIRRGISWPCSSTTQRVAGAVLGVLQAVVRRRRTARCAPTRVWPLGFLPLACSRG